MKLSTLCLCLAAFSNIRCGILGQTIITTDEPCPIPCRNGPEKGQCVTKCDCKVGGMPFFYGEKCEYVYMDVVNLTVTPRTVNFTWPSPPDLEGHYSFLYRRAHDDEEEVSKSELKREHLFDTLYRDDLKMLDENTTRLKELTADNVHYIICILDTREALDTIEKSDLDRVSLDKDDCVFVQTDPSVVWIYTVAFYVVVAFMLAIVIILVVLRMVCDRLQHKPVPVVYPDVKDKPLVVQDTETEKSYTNPDKAWSIATNQSAEYS